MPTYEYLCHGCGHRLEIVQRMSDEPLSECPACHEAALVKQISAVGFQLKGTGWYVTDFRDKGNARKAGSAEGTSESDAKTGSEPKSKSDEGAKAGAKADAGGEAKGSESKSAGSDTPKPKAATASGE